MVHVGRFSLSIVLSVLLNLVILQSTSLGIMRMARPLPGENINQEYLYGEVWNGYVHHGVDFSGPEERSVYSAITGTVDAIQTGMGNTYEANVYSYGNYVRIVSSWNNHTVYTFYAHLSSVNVVKNQQVIAGETIIGFTGNSGYSSGPHLHFEIQLDSVGSTNSRNPEVFMESQNNDSGVLVGFVPNASAGLHVEITPNPKSSIGFAYASIYNTAVNPDDIYEENYAIGDVPSGAYKITCGDDYIGAVIVISNSVTCVAPTTTLSNGTGDGSATITVEPYGTFGTATAAGYIVDGSATYDPIGSYSSASTVFQSSVYFGLFDSGNSSGGVFLHGGGDFLPGDSLCGGKFTSVSSREAKSTFSVKGFDCELTQTLNDKGPQGSTLTQTYKFTNTTDENQSFDLIRHVDGDLYFDGTLIDSGGASVDGKTLFEFDSGDDSTNPSTFVGITNQGGENTGFHVGYRLESYEFTDDIIALGAAVLDGSIAGDTNGDRIIDDPYDVTLTLGNRFLTIIPDQAVTFTTKTIFGAGSPIARAALPTGVVPIQEHNNTINPGETHWYNFINEAVQDIWVVLGFGSEFNLRIYQPDGTLSQEEQTETSPIEMFISNAQTGQWQIEVSAIQTPIPNDPYVLAIGVRDADEDGISDAQDNCPNIPNPEQSDSDEDGIGDICDNCPNIPNPEQSDSDEDGIADVCDNCPNTPNSDQTDSNGDGIGDACEVEEVPGDLDCDGDVDRDDVNVIKANRNQPAIVCPECDIDGDGTITVLDARKLMMMCTCPRCICP